MKVDKILEVPTNTHKDTYVDYSIRQLPSRGRPLTWENDGQPLMDSLPGIYTFTEEQIKIVKHFFQNDMIPDKYRTEIWLISSGAKREMKNNPGYYRNILEDYPDYVPSPYEHQIDLDINRTYPNDPYFTEENLLRLKNILLAYSRRNLSVGYCQGMNFIVGKLLSIFDNEEEVFWLFAQIIEVLLPQDYYSCVYGIMVDTQLLLDFLAMQYEVMPEKVQLYYYKTIMIILINLFCKNTNLKTLKCIYDAFFIDGLTAIFHSIRFTLYYIKGCDEELSDLAGSICLEKMTEYNDDIILQFPIDKINELRKELFTQESSFELTAKTIEILRKNYREDVLEEIKSNFKYKEIMEADNLVRNTFLKNQNNCDLDWPLCIYDRKYRFDIKDYGVYRVLEKPKFIEGYFYGIDDFEIIEEKKEEYKKGKDIMKIYSDLLIERRDHLCAHLGTAKRMREKLEKERALLKQKAKDVNCAYIFENEKDIVEYSLSIYSKLRQSKVSENIFDEINPSIRTTESIVFKK